MSMGRVEPRGLPELLLSSLTVGWLNPEPLVCGWELARELDVLGLEIGFLQQRGDSACSWEVETLFCIKHVE